ncbi:MAG: DUF2249 domain-containing protein [Candidimonas sp.]|nr:MAG: DUF2249 domain-containing protein [Candidimonas sp.]TAM24583.1 MAG: DUF2249 domain-containing protein [Candidimonas sp.]
MNPGITSDVCGLEPPEPLRQIMEALSELAPDQRLCVRIIGTKY